MKLNIKQYLSITIVMALLVSIFACVPANAASYTVPYMYCDFNDGEAVNGFWAKANPGYVAPGYVTDSIVDGVGGSTGAFQRYLDLNNAPAAYLVPVEDSFAPDLFSGKIKVSFWFKIDPTVGTLLSTSNLVMFHPRFFVKTGTGANKELQSTTYTRTAWDNAALNRGEWVYMEMTSNAGGKFSNYTLQSTDVIGLQFRFNGVSNTANRGWTNTNRIAYTIDDFKIEKVIDPYNNTATYAYPWAENLAIDGVVAEDSTLTLSYNYGNNDSTKTEGASHIRVLRETAAGSGKYAVIKEFTGNESQTYDYTVTSDWVGKRLKMEVVPVSTDGSYGATYTKIVGPILADALEVDSEMGEFTRIYDNTTGTYKYSVTSKVSVTNNRADGSDLNAVLIMALLDDENEIVKWNTEAVIVANTSDLADIAEATVKECTIVASAAEYERTSRVECYVWDCGTEELPTVHNTNLTELTPTKQLCTFGMPVAAENDDSISLRNNNYIWTDDTEELSATVKVLKGVTANTVKTVVALYDEDGYMLSAETEEKDIDFSQDNEWLLTADVAENNGQNEAVTAKFFAWCDTDSEPIICETAIEKTQNGDFIYIDAESTAASENGSFNAPFKSLASAQAEWRTQLKSSSESDVYVILKSGEYVDSDYQPLKLTKDDRVEDKQLIFTSYEGEKAKISGAMHLSGSGFSEYENGIYRMSVPEGTDTRQLYINGIKATRARTVEDPAGFVNLDLNTDASSFENKGLTCTDSSYADFKYPDEIELVFINKWRHIYIRPDAVSHGSGDNAGLSHFTFDDEVDSEGNVIGNMRAWRQINAIINTKSTVPVYLENALELLDEEGEWYLDTHENYLYYKPRSFENIATSDVIIPKTEKLITINGVRNNSNGDVAAIAGNIDFKNVDFEYAAWNEPTTERRFICGQGATYNLDDTFNFNTGTKFPDGAIDAVYVNNVNFDNCDFSRLGATALKMESAQNCNIVGNEFYEISGSAVVLGIVSGSTAVWNLYESKPLLQTKNVFIENNYIHKVATDYNSAAAVNLGNIKDITVKNNEITDAAYDGLHIGWGWDLGCGIDSEGNFNESEFVSNGVKNIRVENNYIHNVMNDRLFDGAAIYMVGTTSGDCAIKGNYIQDSLSTAYIYPDQGSCYWTITDNVIDAYRYPITYEKTNALFNPLWLNIWMHTIRANDIYDNYSTFENYRHDGIEGTFEQAEIYPERNWSDNALEVIENAGIEDEYRSRFDFHTQTLTIPIRMDISVGETQQLNYAAITSNDKTVDLSNLDISIVSDNTDVAKVTEDGIVGVAAGRAWITLKVLEYDNGDIVHYDEYTFCVVVS